MITILQFETTLKSVGGEVVKINDEFKRPFQIKINALGTEIVFEWWSNLCIAYIGDIHIFGISDIEISRDWPNKFKINMHLIKDTDIIAVIPIERYEEKINEPQN